MGRCGGGNCPCCGGGNCPCDGWNCPCDGGNGACDAAEGRAVDAADGLDTTDTRGGGRFPGGGRTGAALEGRGLGNVVGGVHSCTGSCNNSATDLRTMGCGMTRLGGGSSIGSSSAAMGLLP